MQARHLNRYYQKILILILLLYFLLACSKEAAPISIHGPAKTINVPSYKLRGTTYVPLISVCQSQGLAWEWDPIGKVVILTKDGLEARLKVGSHRVYVNGRIKDLEKPTLFREGIVVVPISFAKETIDEIFKEWAIPKVKPTPITEKKYTMGTVVIDPGHGGKDPGAIGRYGLKEKDLVLEIARILKKELGQDGVKVVLTRDKDIFIPLGKRARIANDIRADFFISIHANASRARRLRGFEVYHLSEEATDDSARALAAAENASLKYEEKSFDKHTKQLDATVWDLEFTENRSESIELGKSICNAVSKKLAVRDRGIKSARFYVLKGTRMPAVLVEVGYISNTNDASSLKSSYYRRKLTEALADGILSYKKEYEKTNGFTE